MRHQFGSAIYQGWESAAVALHHLDGFGERYQTAVHNGDKLFELLQSSGKFQIARVPQGSNIAKLRLASGGALDQLRERLAEAGIRIGGAKGVTEANLQINETINHRTPEDIAAAFVAAVA